MLRQAFLDIGGHPRSFEYLIDECLQALSKITKPDINKIDFATIFHATSSRLFSVYRLGFLERLLPLCVVGEPVLPSDIAPGTQNIVSSLLIF